MSTTGCQEHGISQGCPLSPFLFSILMTVLLYDADMDSRSRGRLNLPAALVNDLVYADDTLVLAAEQERAELRMNCIARAGSNYALTFNWKKVELPGVQGSRRRGRPRKRWAVEVYRFVKSMADYDRCSLDSLWQLPPSQWRWRAANFCYGA